ncbi:MAG: DUF4376 domain-containing protein [Bacteroidota bacterium]|nr:DUF4376 domain-containing protein [Bacteroidota bacterium]
MVNEVRNTEFENCIYIPDQQIDFEYGYDFIYNEQINKVLKMPDYNILNSQAKDKAKKEKDAKVAAVTVEISSGKVFDGDEKSQDRMLRAIQIAQITGETSTTWRLADNTDVEVTVEELKEALILAGKKMSKIWLT